MSWEILSTIVWELNGAFFLHWLIGKERVVHLNGKEVAKLTQAIFLTSRTFKAVFSHDFLGFNLLIGLFS